MTDNNPHGVVVYPGSSQPTDYLFRVSIKCLIKNTDNEVLVVKESGRGHWDLPGGGMNHGEDIADVIAREMKEEVDLSGPFEYEVIHCEQPKRLSTRDIWQVRLIFKVYPSAMSFSAGVDADDVAFKSPEIFIDSEIMTEQRIYEYAKISDLRDRRS